MAQLLNSAIGGAWGILMRVIGMFQISITININYTIVTYLINYLLIHNNVIYNIISMWLVNICVGLDMVFGVGVAVSLGIFCSFVARQSNFWVYLPPPPLLTSPDTNSLSLSLPLSITLSCPLLLIQLIKLCNRLHLHSQPILCKLLIMVASQIQPK